MTPDRPNPSPEPTGLRLRALVIGLPLTVLLSFVTIYSDMVVASIQVSVMALAPAALGVLLLVVGLSRLLKLFVRRSILTGHDVFVIYVMMMIAVLMSGRGTIEKLIPPLITTNYFATPENNHMGLFGPNLPDHLIAFDPDGLPQQAVAKGFYEGNARVHWRRDWLGPIVSWSGLLCFVYLTFLCLAALLRRQWADHEKLIFPLTTLPLTVLDDRAATPFFRNKLTWIGFAIPVAVSIVNGLHANIPAVPELKIKVFLQQYLTARPWNGIGYTPLTISFAAIGFFYFLANDMLLSLWLFFALTRVADILATQLGFDLPSMPRHPPRVYVGYQNIGAYAVLALYLLRTGWPHFQRVWRRALPGRERPKLDDSAEMISGPVAVWGAAIGFAGAVLWCLHTGLDPGLAVLQIGIYLFVVAVIMARGVAEAGLLQTETTFRTVDILKAFGSQSQLGPRNLTMLAFLDTVLARDLRGLLLSNVLDDQKIAGELGFPRRKLLAPVLLAMLVTFIAGCYFFLTLVHREGIISMYGYPHWNARTLFDDAAAAMQQEIPVLRVYGWSMSLGVLLCGALVWLRTHLVWWPLHPFGYAVCGAWTMVVFWFSALITWVLKLFILRAGGMKTYRRLMPFFLGLAFGDFFAAFCWTGIVFGGDLANVEINAPTFGFD